MMPRRTCYRYEQIIKAKGIPQGGDNCFEASAVYTNGYVYRLQFTAKCTKHDKYSLHIPG